MKTSILQIIYFLHKMALRLILNVPVLHHSAPLSKQHQIMSIHKGAPFRSATMIYEVCNGHR